MRLPSHTLISNNENYIPVLCALDLPEAYFPAVNELCDL